MNAKFSLLFEGGKLSNKGFNINEVSSFLSKAQTVYIKRRLDLLKNKSQIGYGDLLRNNELAGVIAGSTSITKDYMIQGTKENGALRAEQLPAIIPSNVYQYGVFIQLPDDVLFILNEECDISHTTYDTRYNLPVRETDYKEYKSLINSPYDKPNGNLVFSFDYGNLTPGDTAGYTASGTEASPETVSVANATKEYSLSSVNYNIKGITASTYVDGATPATEKWIAFTNYRSKYLLQGGNWRIEEYNLHYIKKPSDIIINLTNPTAQQSSILPEFTHQEIVDIAAALASGTIMPDINKYEVNTLESKMNE